MAIQKAGEAMYFYNINPKDYEFAFSVRHTKNQPDKLSGRIFDAKIHRRISSIGELKWNLGPETSREDLEADMKLQLLTAVDKLMAEKKSSADSDSPSELYDQIEAAFDKYSSDVKAHFHDDPDYVHLDRWGKRTMDQVLGSFRYKFLPYLKTLDNDAKNFDLHALTQFVETAVNTNQNRDPDSAPNSAGLNDTSRHITWIGDLYDDLRKKNRLLPCFPFEKVSGPLKVVSKSQIRSLTQAQRDALVRLLEDDIPQNPALVFCAVLVYDVGARIAEASAIRMENIVSKESFDVVQIRAQVHNGKLKKLKSDAGYRDVPTSYWGKVMLEMAWSLIPDETKADPTKILVTPAALAKYIKTLLNQCGCNDAFWRELNQQITLHPDRNPANPALAEPTAYLLRREVSTRMLNCEGLWPDEIDFCLGHKNKNSKSVKANLARSDEMLRLAEKRERYIHDAEYSLHPALHPITLDADSHSHTDLMEFEKYRFVNTSSGPVQINLTALAAEANEAIRLLAPAGSIARHSTINQKANYMARSVIGRALPTSKEDRNEFLDSPQLL